MDTNVFTTPTTANGQDSLWHHHAIVYDGGLFLNIILMEKNVRTCTSGTCLFPSQPSDSITLGRSFDRQILTTSVDICQVSVLIMVLLDTNQILYHLLLMFNKILELFS